MKLLFFELLTLNTTLALAAKHCYRGRECAPGECVSDYKPCNGTCPANRCLRLEDTDEYDNEGNKVEYECLKPRKNCDSMLGTCKEFGYFGPEPPDFNEKACPVCADEKASVILCDGRPICSDVPCGDVCTGLGVWRDSRRLCQTEGKEGSVTYAEPEGEAQQRRNRKRESQRQQIN